MRRLQPLYKAMWGSLLAFAMLLVMTLSAAAQSQTRLDPGCRAMPPAEVAGRAEDLDYVLTETAGLNTVLVHLFGQTWLSDRSCFPDADQGALAVVVSYGATSPRSPAEEAEDIVFGKLARAHPELTPREFPRTTVSAHGVNGLPGAEAFSQDATANGRAIFRYALVFAFPDGAKGFVSASGPLDRFDALRPDLRRIGAGLQPRRNAE